MIKRSRHLASIKKTLARYPVCALLGPRQCGKTTLARELVTHRRSTHYFDLETAVDRERLLRPEITLSPLTGLIVIDEIQRQPELFTTLRPLADRARSSTKFLILGSASPEIIRGVSESLAGRVGFVDLGGFDLPEVGEEKWMQLWLRGGFPKSFLAGSGSFSLRWRHDFIRTFLERDIPLLGIRVSPETLRRFWMMVAHYHGQIWNGSELARALGTSERTVRHYLDLLSGAFVLRQLQPWFENISKRQYKSPKIYVRDSGILHALLDIESTKDLESHPKYGASWEGFALEQVLSLVDGRQAYFWGTHAGAELDLLLFHRGKRYGIEFKAADAPSMTKSLHTALDDLRLHHAWIAYPGKETYSVHEKVEVVQLSDLLKILGKW